MIFRKKNNRKIDKYSPITDLQQRPRKFWFATTTGMSCGLKHNTQQQKTDFGHLAAKGRSISLMGTGGSNAKKLHLMGMINLANYF